MLENKRIGILTSGGDCGGLNAVLKGAAQMAIARGLEVFVIPFGYAGLYNLADTEKLVKLDVSRADAINSFLAGSEAGSSRVSIPKISDPDKYKRIRAGMEKFSIDGLIIAGGDDTGAVVLDLHEHGIACIHVPKTMDLDLHTYSVGGDSAVNRISRFIEEVKTTGRSHNRIMVVEVWGRYTGHIAFRGGVGGNADCILIPEIPVDFDVVYDHLKRRYMRRIRESDMKLGTYVIVVSEAIKDLTGGYLYDDTISVDSFGHRRFRGTGKYVRNQIAKRIENDPEISALMREARFYVKDQNVAPEIRDTAPGYLTRSGYSSGFDVNFGRDIGAGAVLLLMGGFSGVTVSSMSGGKVHYMATEAVIRQHQVDDKMVSFYEEQGVCFGRKPVSYQPAFSEIKKKGWCYLC
jgi:6-phosphofructokinase 1